MYIPSKKVLEKDNGDIEIYVYGVPFNGPLVGGVDLDGERFTKSTDIGPLNTVLSYFSHAKDPLFGKELIGVAERIEQDENGWVYKIIVDRHHKYRNVLKALADQGYLGSSSTPYARSAEKESDGVTWKRWHVVEVSLTPEPANPNAEVILGKSLEGAEMTKTKSEQAEAPESVQPEKSQVQQAIEAAVNNTVAELQSPEHDTTVNIEKSLNLLIENQTSVNEKLDRLEKAVADIIAVLPEMAATMTRALMSTRSVVEKEVQARIAVPSAINGRQAAPRNKIPAHAPGNEVR